MSYLAEKKAYKVLRRTSDSTTYYRWQPMDYAANEDAICRYSTLNTTVNATAVYPEWQYKSAVSAFYECIPVIRANAAGSNSSFNFYTAGKGYTGLLPRQYASAMRYYNKATNTTVPLTSHIFLKSFALDKDVGYTGYQYQVSGNSDTTSYGTDNTGGCIFFLPIADNR
jgi:hypothetical protein